MINYCHLPWLYYWSFTGFPVLSYLLFTRYYRGCGMGSLCIWCNFLWYASLRTDLVRPIRICCTLRLSKSKEIWFGSSALHEILLVSEYRNAQEGGRQGPERCFSIKKTSVVTLHPLSQIAELFIYANNKLCSLKESILWPKPLPHSQLDPDVVLQQLAQLPLISEIKSETPRGQVVFALNADTDFSAVSLLLLHFSCLFKLMCSWWAGSWDIPAMPTTGHAGGVNVTADMWCTAFLEEERVMQKFSSSLWQKTAVVQRCQILWHTRELWEWWQRCWKGCSWAFNRSLQPGVET